MKTIKNDHGWVIQHEHTGMFWSDEAFAQLDMFGNNSDGWVRHGFDVYDTLVDDPESMPEHGVWITLSQAIRWIIANNQQLEKPATWH